MMSSDKNTDDNSGCSRGKATISNSSTRPPPAALNCPRCDSSNTKFCYYNNYSLSQPRHFCKTCKRYWTKGGALRNVPIGGGCRKNKKTTKASSRFSSADFKHNSSTYSNIAGGFKPFNGLEFQLGGGLTNFPRYNNINISTPPQLVSSFRDNSTIQSGAISTFELDPNNHGTQIMAFNSFPLSSSSSSSMLKQDQVDNFGGFSGGGGLLEEIGPAAANTNNLASPIESLSSINQDLHWKLQQERFNMMFNGGSDNSNFEQQNGMISTTNHLQSLSETQKPQAILFQNLEVSTKLTADDSKKENNGIINSAAANLATTEFFFSDSSTYAPAVNQIPTTNSNSSNIGNGKGIQTWANFDDQYKALL